MPLLPLRPKQLGKQSCENSSVNLCNLSAPPSDSIERALFPRAVRPISVSKIFLIKINCIELKDKCGSNVKLPVEFWNMIRELIYLVWDLLLRPTTVDRPSKSVDLICILVHLLIEFKVFSIMFYFLFYRLFSFWIEYSLNWQGLIFCKPFTAL